MARPSIINDELIDRFCKWVRISGSIETAIKVAGIGRESYYGWSRAVRDGKGSALQKRFIEAVDRAEGEVKLIREKMLEKHFDRNWQALAWWLERKHSNEYGQRGPPPLPDADASQEERKADRVIWAPAVPLKKKPPPAEASGPGAPATEQTGDETSQGQKQETPE